MTFTPEQTESLLACACGMPRHPVEGYPSPFTAAWHVKHKERHLFNFPDLDQRSRDNLDALIRWASK